MDQQRFYIVMTIAAAVIALSFIVQAAMFMFIYGAIKRLTGIAASVQAKAEPLFAKAGPVLEQVQDTIGTVRVSVEKISAQTKDAFDKVTLETRAVAAAVSASSQEISRLAQHQVEQISQTLDYTSATVQRQVSELDALLVRTQDRFEEHPKRCRRRCFSRCASCQRCLWACGESSKRCSAAIEKPSIRPIRTRSCLFSTRPETGSESLFLGS